MHAARNESLPPSAGFLKKIIFVAAVGITVSSAGQTLATFKVTVPPQPGGLEIPVEASLQGITNEAATRLTLLDARANKLIDVPFQITTQGGKTLHWMVPSDERNATDHVYRLVRSPAPTHEPLVKAVVTDRDITMQASGKNLLRYQSKTAYPPAGVDTAYRRSGFIHPLWSPAGKVLTRIQPPDHYHHYGLWNPWTHTLYKGDTVDFWNIGNKQGTVRFAGLLSANSGDVFAEYAVVHEHVSFKKGGDDVAIREIQTVRVYTPQHATDYYMADINIALRCISDPITLLTYRYGGLGWRTTGEWDRNNSEVLTSEGKHRKDADGTKARWCIVQGLVGGDTAGAVMMSHPANFNHPEPLRIWPENQYDRGDMFANFSPTKDRDWPLQPGNTYVLRYRLLVFDGKFDKAKAEAAWKNFASPLVVTVIHKKLSR